MLRRTPSGGSGLLRRGAAAGLALFASIAIWTFTSSPTSIPPVSRALFQTRPKSFRLSVTAVSRPIFSLPKGSLPSPSSVTGSVTDFVTPRMVRSPVTRKLSLPLALTDVLLKLIVGLFATSKKSAERRCSSRRGSFVSMLFAWIVNSTVEFSGLARSTWIAPA